ncbi:MAG: NAD-binding protein, partial [Candidatus Aenigmarchaeota archaeon]|nr:NAD-binding protein [Candidatus Aenigmarchaeota archaeon]
GREVLDHIKDMKYIVIDHDPEIVDALKSHNCIYGVPDNHYTLDLLGVKKARFIIITAPDYPMASFVIEESRKVNKKIKIMARATSIEEALGLYKVGADIVMIPEVLTGKEMAKKLGEMIKGKDFEKEREEHITAFGKAFSDRFLI